MSQKNGNGDNETLNEALKGIDDLLAQVTTMYDSCEEGSVPLIRNRRCLSCYKKVLKKWLMLHVVFQAEQLVKIVK